MLCRKPFMAGSLAFGCGQCLPCRVNKSRQWMWRQVLESWCHDDNCFVTLTYDIRNIPGNWSLDPRALRLFIKRLRRSLPPESFRYFAVGEYGERSARPHYHLSLFGLSGYSSHVVGKITRAWGCGFVQVAPFSHYTAQYCAGYVVKKLVDYRDGRTWNYPEFARMSNRPGLGAKAMETVAKQLLGTYQSWQSGDVPSVLHIGRRSVPLSRYLIARLRRDVGFDAKYVQQVKGEQSFLQSVQMQSLLDNLSEDATIKKKYLENIEGKLRQVEARYHNNWMRRSSREAL